MDLALRPAARAALRERRASAPGAFCEQARLLPGLFAQEGHSVYVCKLVALCLPPSTWSRSPRSRSRLFAGPSP
jgi:hypothetical protein